MQKWTSDGASINTSLSSRSHEDEVLAAAVAFKKPPRNIVISEHLLTDQRNAKQRIEREIAQNKRDQVWLDNDIILSGFTQKPDTKIVQNAIEYFNLPKNVVKSHYMFETKTEKTIHHVVITFNDKSAKLKVLNAIEGKRLRMNELTTVKAGKSNPIISCQRRLSKFNNIAHKQLSQLKATGIISEIKFDDLFFAFKVNEQSQWKVVTHLEILKPYNSIMETRNKLIRK